MNVKCLTHSDRAGNSPDYTCSPATLSMSQLFEITFLTYFIISIFL